MLLVTQVFCLLSMLISSAKCFNRMVIIEVHFLWGLKLAIMILEFLYDLWLQSLLGIDYSKAVNTSSDSLS